MPKRKRSDSAAQAFMWAAGIAALIENETVRYIEHPEPSAATAAHLRVVIERTQKQPKEYFASLKRYFRGNPRAARTHCGKIVRQAVAHYESVSSSDEVFSTLASAFSNL